MLRKLILLVGVSAAVWSAPASATEHHVSPAMVPYLYRYGACVFNASLGETEARLANCRRLRTQIEAHAEAPFAIWHFGDRLRRSRQFTKALDLLEEEARSADAQRKTVPESIISYMKCMSGPTINSNSFLAGTSIEYTELNRVCRAAIGQNGTETENQRARRLMQRLRLRGRELYNPGPAPRTIIYHRGFLGLHRLPSDDE